MRSLRLGIALIAILSAALGAPLSEGVAEDNMPVAYLLTDLPELSNLPDHLPGNAKDVVIAKVRLEQPVWGLGGRHREGISNDILFARVKITEVRGGSAEVGQVLDVLLGLRSDHRNFTYPYTPDQRTREYAAVMYLAEDGRRRLAPFPISRDQYAQWSAEVSAYEGLRATESLRGTPGFRE